MTIFGTSIAKRINLCKVCSFPPHLIYVDRQSSDKHNFAQFLRHGVYTVSSSQSVIVEDQYHGHPWFNHTETQYHRRPQARNRGYIAAPFTYLHNKRRYVWMSVCCRWPAERMGRSRPNLAWGLMLTQGVF